MTRQYQTGKFVLLKQCNYCANMGTSSQKNPKMVFLPSPNAIRVNIIDANFQLQRILSQKFLAPKKLGNRRFAGACPVFPLNKMVAR